jgi:hypothetical protein
MLEGAIMTTAVVILFRLAFLWLRHVHRGNVANETAMRERERQAETIWREMQDYNRETQAWAAWYESTKTPRSRVPRPDGLPEIWQLAEEARAHQGGKIVLRPGDADASFMDR